MGEKWKDTKRKVMTPEEVWQLIEATKNMRELIMVILGAYGGLRVSEITTVTPIDIDKVMHIRSGKGDKDRYACMDEEMVPILHTYAKEEGIAPDSPILPFTTRTVQRWFYELQDRAWGKRPYSIHTLRHTNATRLIGDGMPLALVQKHLGHSDLKTTQVYLHVCKKAMRDAYDKVKII